MRSMNKAIVFTFIFLILVVALSTAMIFSLKRKMTIGVTDFETCAKLYPVIESDPPRCKTPKGNIFIQQISQTPLPSNGVYSDETTEFNIIVDEPKANAEVSSGFLLKGRARVFENVLEYELKTRSGKVLRAGNLVAKSPDIGQFGPFETRIVYSRGENTGLLLNVFSSSPKDGERINIVTLPLVDK